VRTGASGVASVAAGGSSFFARAQLLAELGLDPERLQPGAELTEAEAAVLALADRAFEAEERGLSLLARAEQSRSMLRAKLESRGLPAQAVKLALERLSAAGILDDGRFAAAYIASRLSRRAEGPSSLAAALRAKGLDGETAKEAVAAALGAGSASGERRAALDAAIAREMRRRKGDREAVRGRLRALGYRPAEIREALDGDEA
jgi:regulatory protein